MISAYPPIPNQGIPPQNPTPNFDNDPWGQQVQANNNVNQGQNVPPPQNTEQQTFKPNFKKQHPAHKTPNPYYLHNGSINHDYVYEISGFSLIILLFMHWFIKKNKTNKAIDRSILNSIGGAITLGFVFLHLLPETFLEIHQLKDVFESDLLNSDQFLTFLLFLCMLFGFIVLYTFEKIAHDYTVKGREAGRIVFRLQFYTFCYLSFSVAFSLPYYIQNGIYVLALYVITMSAHFMLEEFNMSHHFPTKFTKWKSTVLSLFSILGWFTGFTFFYNDMWFVRVFLDAILAGALILNTVKLEFSLFEGHSHYPTFIICIIFKILIVFAMIYIKFIQV